MPKSGVSISVQRRMMGDGLRSGPVIVRRCINFQDRGEIILTSYMSIMVSGGAQPGCACGSHFLGWRLLRVIPVRLAGYRCGTEIGSQGIGGPRTPPTGRRRPVGMRASRLTAWPAHGTAHQGGLAVWRARTAGRTRLRQPRLLPYGDKTRN